MTFEKKCLIEPSDIVAVQYECGHCHAAIVVPIGQLSPDQIGSVALRTCSYCQTASGFSPGTQETNTFLNFNIALAQIAAVLKARNLKLKLDIKCDGENEKE